MPIPAGTRHPRKHRLADRDEDVRPLPIGLTLFRDQPPIQWADLMAFATMMIVPVVFVVFQRQFVQGVTTSGLQE